MHSFFITGAKGLPGVPGQVGFHGLPGDPSNEKGNRGDPGAQGLPGIKGMPGVSGKRGISGFDGMSGPKVSRVMLSLYEEKPQASNNLSFAEILILQFLYNWPFTYLVSTSLIIVLEEYPGLLIHFCSSALFVAHHF